MIKLGIAAAGFAVFAMSSGAFAADHKPSAMANDSAAIAGVISEGGASHISKGASASSNATALHDSSAALGSVGNTTAQIGSTALGATDDEGSAKHGLLNHSASAMASTGGMSDLGGGTNNASQAEAHDLMK
jgi:hypothetical protein